MSSTAGVKSSVFFGVLVTLCGWSSAASAEPSAATAAFDAPPAPAPAGPQPAALPPDIVQLRNGGMVRGTIAEIVPGEAVTIVTMTGETRKIPFADVSYAGPAEKAPSGAVAAAAKASPAPEETDSASVTRSYDARPFAVVHAAEARVSYASEPESGTLFVRTATAQGYASASGYDELCTAPCSLSLPSGKHVFSVRSPGSRWQVEADPIQIPAGNSTLISNYVSRAGTRTALIVIGSLVAVGGITLTVVSAILRGMGTRSRTGVPCWRAPVSSSWASARSPAHSSSATAWS